MMWKLNYIMMMRRRASQGQGERGGGRMKEDIRVQRADGEALLSAERKIITLIGPY